PEIAAGRAFEARNESSTLGGESIRLGTPIRIHGTDTPWSVVANLSRNEALAPVFAVRNLVVVTGAAVLLVMCGILVWLVASIARPIHAIAERLRTGAHEVSAAADDISHTSHEMADAAS